ncbi:phage tail protein [Rhodocyclus tenuis]|uniref:Phage tail protein n=1 Tax=Rhodocyclus gracilis TaxID=2929842 RepID=A0ABX0WGW2_9RHOO|nr:phage tail protein [Rhodocyclus gracilis]MRD73290.1 phage tail protein [Rhodocyclus gracilis]NJA87709.1 phage tail protein [Rhodocyclus gracilis]
MDEELVEVRFDGLRYGYWQKVDIRESVDDLCSSVRLAITRPGNGSSFGLTANTVADVLIGDAPVTTVRPDSVRRLVDADSHAIHIEARSLGRELVDCQYSKTLSGLKLGEIVKRICDVFKVPVLIEAETAVVPEFSMQCEQPANALINAVRAANLLLYPLPDGGLVLTNPTDGAPVASLEFGGHIKRYEVVDEFKLRFSDYVIKGYDYASDAALKGAVKDEGIGFFRPMHIIADRHGSGLGGCDRRANLERNRRLARAHRIELEVQGWRYLDSDGNWQRWAINTQVRVIIPDEGIDGVFLIGERAFRLDDKGGSITLLQVMHRNAFLGEEKKKSKRGAGVKESRK